MTKAELLTALGTKFHTVGAPAQRVDKDSGEPIIEDGFTTYKVKCWEVTGDIIKDTNLLFRVSDDGGPAEAAFYAGSEPKPEPQENASAALTAFLNGKISDSTVRSYRIMEGTLNIQTKTVVVEALMPSWAWAFFLVTHDGQDFQIAPFA